MTLVKLSITGWIVLCLFSIATAQDNLPVTVKLRPLSQGKLQCSGGFITHELEHTTTVPGGDVIRSFEANGAGVAINDLDKDGDADIVLGNHAAANTILWNDGGLQFRPEQVGEGDSRAVHLVDIDGDGWQDIFFTRTASAPNFWRNTGDGRFEFEFLAGIAEPLYAGAWADLDDDGDLDLVGGTYDAGLLNSQGQDFLLSPRHGVYVYENDDLTFRGTRIANDAQALAVLLHDLNNDERLDIIVGNDFAVPDNIWYQSDDGWQPADAFQTFTHSTMSYDAGDIDNDGQFEIFSTDMKPYSDDKATQAAWYPITESMADPFVHPEQVMANALQIITNDNSIYENLSEDRGLDASGWSWSGKFADFDQDGFLDMYIVNGMAEATIFAHLPDHELREANQAFRNDGTGNFISAPDWNLASMSGGRGMSIADLDNDGDLDIVVNNLRSPAQLFENQLCTGSSLQVDVRSLDSANIDAIGTTLVLHTDTGTYYRIIRSASAYLSGDYSRIHFGFPAEAILKSLEVRWFDGQQSQITLEGNERSLLIERQRDE